MNYSLMTMYFRIMEIVVEFLDIINCITMMMFDLSRRMKVIFKLFIIFISVAGKTIKFLFKQFLRKVIRIFRKKNVRLLDRELVYFFCILNIRVFFSCIKIYNLLIVRMENSQEFSKFLVQELKIKISSCLL